MLASASASRSVGCQVSAGNAAAQWTACSPVPLAISSTIPRAGSTRRSTARIGSRLRAVEGEVRAAFEIIRSCQPPPPTLSIHELDRRALLDHLGELAHVPV